jgi:co-chaperonin GroES (HSP10)
MKIRPVNNYILVKVEKLTTSKSGIINTPESKQQEYGTVVDAGDSIFKNGQTVYFKNYTPITIKLNGEELHFIKADDILGVA